jgi:hypothetical protein
MVYVVQNYLASFGLIHNLVCGSFTKDHVSETGSVSVLRPCKTSTYQTMTRVQKSQIVLYKQLTI